MKTPSVDQLSEVVTVLRSWQLDGAALQLHPGDIGWFWRFGAEATAMALRTWRTGGQIRAVGLLDGPQLLRLAISPDVQQDEELARRLVRDLSQPARAGISVEAPPDALIRDLLIAEGWGPDELRAPLRHDFAGPAADPAIRIDLIGPHQVDVRVRVQRASFDKSTFTAERWRTMAAGFPYTDARCLVGYGDRGDPVAAVTVWSAGPGRPGLLEPMGVHRDHRGRGYGKAITLAAVAALRDMGSSAALVGTSSSNIAAVATYMTAGFQPLPEIPDLRQRMSASPE